jgi:hypothetical protein
MRYILVLARDLRGREFRHQQLRQSDEEARGKAIIGKTMPWIIP